MFKVIRVGNNRLDIEMSGSLQGDEMKRALDQLLDLSVEIDQGLMLFDVIDYHLPSIEAIIIEFSRMPELFGWIKRFERAAVLTDKRWLRMVSELEGALMPGLSIKAFDREQRSDAVAWLTGSEP